MPFEILTIEKPKISAGAKPVALPEGITFETATPEQLYLAGPCAVRFEVFVVEQKCNPEMECDEVDADAVHFAVVHENEDGKQVAGTCRVFAASPDVWKLGRMAIRKSHRGQQLGLLLGKAAEDYVRRETNAKQLALHAQKDKQRFYEKLGYVHDASAGEWDEEGMVHVKMVMSL